MREVIEILYGKGLNIRNGKTVYACIEDSSLGQLADEQVVNRVTSERVRSRLFLQHEDQPLQGHRDLRNRPSAPISVDFAMRSNQHLLPRL